jgi:hypothetical protein
MSINFTTTSPEVREDDKISSNILAHIEEQEQMFEKSPQINNMKTKAL